MAQYAKQNWPAILLRLANLEFYSERGCMLLGFIHPSERYAQNLVEAVLEVLASSVWR